jgi:hypothetical protein
MSLLLGHLHYGFKFASDFGCGSMICLCVVLCKEVANSALQHTGRPHS